MCVNENWNAPIRLNADGDVQCYATNGKDCIVTRKRGCPSLLKIVERVESQTSKDRVPRRRNVLTCGTDHMRKYPVHWCHHARSALLQGKTATVICTSTGQVLGSTTQAFPCAMSQLFMA